MWRQKIQTWLMLVLTVWSIIIQPLSMVTAHATEIETNELDQEPLENKIASSITEESGSGTEGSIGEEPSHESPREPGSDEHKSDANTSESTDASSVELESGHLDSLESFIQANQLIQGQDGQLYTTTASNYVQNSIQALLELIGLGRATNQIVTVPSNVHISNIDIRLSNGNREFGWYGKRVNGEVALCIEQGVAMNVGPNGGYTSTERDTDLLKKISLVNYYGLVIPGYSLHRELMTQLLAWEQQGITPTSISGEFDMATYQVFKSTVMTNVNRFYTKPSFDKQNITLKVGQSIKLTDSNGAFTNYERSPISNTANVDVSILGNSVTLTAKQNSNETGTVNFRYDIAQNYRGTPVVYEHPYTQNVVVSKFRDPSFASITINVLKNGNARVKKVDADTGQALAGAKFKFTTDDGQSKELTTGSDGTATWNDLLVDTKVTITEIQSPDGYVLNTTPQVVTIKANETTTVTVDNKEQLANLTVIKEDAETGNTPQGAAQLAGAEYTLTDLSGKVAGSLVMKDVNGVAKGELKGLKLGTYKLKETKAPEGYVVDPTEYEVNLMYAGQNASVAVHSKTVKDRVIKGGIEGYKFGSEDLVSRIRRFFRFDGRDAIKPPLKGVEITATSHSTGQVYSDITDEKGYFRISNLSYDTYTISETKGVDGYRLFEPFDVKIEADGYYFHYLLEDEIIKNKLQVVKVDEETGKTIPRTGAEFKIWDTWANDNNGAWVEMTKPNSLDKTDVFATNDEGYLVTTEALPYGIYRYKLHEIKAPEGYVRQKEPVTFSVNTESNDEVIQIRFINANQKGQVHVHKSVETGTTVTEKESVYGSYHEIGFTQQNGEGFEFKIRPTEDIVTSDGTVKYEAGKYLQENGKDYVLETDSNGDGTSPDFLYLGKYEAVETKAPDGAIMAKDPIPFEITYAGQDAELTSTSVAVENSLQQLNIYGHKKQEVVSGWEEGQAVINLEEAKNGQVFALRLAEELPIGETVLFEDSTLAYAVVKDGIVAFEGVKLPNQEIKLYLQETAAGENHVLDETKYPFTYTPSNNEDTNEINVWADGAAYDKQSLTRVTRDPIVNRLARQSVELIKRDRLNEQPLKDVPFLLYSIAENNKEVLIGEFKTDKDGKINVPDLPTGSYRFKEGEPLEGYLPLEDTFDFTVSVENDGKKIVLEAYNEREPLEITTLFASVDGKKELDPTIDNRLKDTVWVKGPAIEIGHTYTVVTKYKNTITGAVVSEDTSTYTAKSKDDTFEVYLDLKANTLKSGDQLTATHTIYYEKDQENEVAKEDDLKNKDQTVTFRTPGVLPKTGSISSLILMSVGLMLVNLVYGFWMFRKEHI